MRSETSKIKARLHIHYYIYNRCTKAIRLTSSGVSILDMEAISNCNHKQTCSWDFMRSMSALHWGNYFWDKYRLCVWDRCEVFWCDCQRSRTNTSLHLIKWLGLGARSDNWIRTARVTNPTQKHMKNHLIKETRYKRLHSMNEMLWGYNLQLHMTNNDRSNYWMVRHSSFS